ncbi:MAG TPA: ABC transporter permease [Candidatus Acidoferrales bacterium]|nr:ABC transporter permease [Candidatus Acidoferrales bacterium]
MNWARFTAVIAKEWAEITRDRLFLGLAFIVPPVLMLVFGLGMNLDVEDIPLAIIDYDHSPQSRDYAYKMIDSRYFDFKGYLHDEREIAKLISRGDVRAVVVIPPKFGEDLVAGRSVAVQTLLDGQFPLRANIARGYIGAINANYSQELIANFLSRAAGFSPDQARQQMGNLRIEMRMLYNQSGKSIWSLAPKLIMMVLMMTPPLLTAVSVVREKERGSILNIYASTVSRAEFLLGKLMPYAGISMVNGVFLWALAVFYFQAPFKGSFGFFLLATAIYSFTTTGIGLLVSSFVKTQIAAVVMTMVVTLVPAILFSGMLFPLSSMGPEAQAIAHLAPAMHYGQVIDGAFMKGIGLEKLWSSVVSLLVYALVLFVLAHRFFTKRPQE